PNLLLMLYLCSSNHSNCTDLVQLLKSYYLPVAYSLIFIVGVAGNITSIGIYLTKLRPWKSSSIIMVNLAVADFLYVLTLPFLVYYYSTWEMWPLCKFMCRFVRFGFHFNLYGSILLLTCLAVFRYLVVIKPLSAAQIQQKRWGILACSAVWISSATEITPMLNMISVDNNSKCLDFMLEVIRCVIWELQWVPSSSIISIQLNFINIAPNHSKQSPQGALCCKTIQ
uniref:Oxoglutarate (alpha-ketoglutarate) receptor 1a, tandem duplicate 2 n=1 Tax=Amphilophus citrinellus TaxID=61819 RepID=A0A3Q0STV8_AMPCI